MLLAMRVCKQCDGGQHRDTHASGLVREAGRVSSVSVCVLVRVWLSE